MASDVIGQTNLTGVKTDFDPCPDGWRVPASFECGSLITALSSSTRYTTGRTQNFLFIADNGREVCFPSAGAYYLPLRVDGGFLATSNQVDGNHAVVVSTGAELRLLLVINYGNRNNLLYGSSVRCIQDIPDDWDKYWELVKP